MNGTIAVTDYGWYDFLRQHPAPEVNFWTPSARRRFSAPAFSPFFFKLKAPHRAIAGFGYFAKWSALPPWLAWECFGKGNGCESLSAFEERLRAIRARIHYVPRSSVATIGCILLVQPVLFPLEAWIRQPADWHDRTVTSQSYDLTVGEGLRVWEQCQERAGLSIAAPSATSQVAELTGARYGSPQLVAPRLGQGTFRVSVTDAYGRSCAVTGEHSLPALEAAHIQAYTSMGPHEVRNGILLRADFHRLFDKGYATITPDLHIEVSSRLREDYSNGRSYYPFHGKPIRVPESDHDRPAAEFLAWHNQHVYLG